VVLQRDDAKAAAAGGTKGLALPFKPMSIAFKDICYYVDTPGVSSGCCFADVHWLLLAARALVVALHA
jgi:hypothetical protein